KTQRPTTAATKCGSARIFFRAKASRPSTRRRSRSRKSRRRSCTGPSCAATRTEKVRIGRAMNQQPAIDGVWCARLTPLDARGAIDHDRFAAHVLRLFDAGVDGIAPFGTTGEGPSFGVVERKQALEALIAAGDR